jgi:hypothetical protein
LVVVSEGGSITHANQSWMTEGSLSLSLRSMQRRTRFSTNDDGWRIGLDSTISSEWKCWASTADGWMDGGFIGSYSNMIMANRYDTPTDCASAGSKEATEEIYLEHTIWELLPKGSVPSEIHSCRLRWYAVVDSLLFHSFSSIDRSRNGLLAGSPPSILLIIISIRCCCCCCSIICYYYTVWLRAFGSDLLLTPTCFQKSLDWQTDRQTDTHTHTHTHTLGTI